MNHISLTLVIVLVILVVVLLLLVIVVLNKSNTVKEEKKIKPLNSTTVKEDVLMPSSIGLFLPPSIEKLSKTQLLYISREIFGTYQVFDYKSMDIYELDKKEWHTWQVSLLLMLFKKDEEFFISNKESIFHQFLLNSNENDIKNLMKSILKKYDNYVNIEHTKDDLCKEHIWTNKDISIIFFFLSSFKNYKK
jgi:hypothetical protein